MHRARAAAFLAAALTAAALPAPAAEDAEALYEDALVRLEQGDPRAAVVQLKNVLQADPRHLPARLLMGRAYLELGDPAAAEKALEAARELGAADDLVIPPLARAFLRAGRHEALLERFTGEGLSPPARARVLSVRGLALAALDRLDEAERTFGEASALAPDLAEPRTGLAAIAIRRGRLDEAERLAAGATAADDLDPEAWFVTGEVRRLRHDLEGAVRAYDRALDLDAGHRGSRLARAASLIDLGRIADARRDVDRLRRSGPRDPQAAYLDALLLAREGRVDEAARVLDAVGIAVLEQGSDFITEHPPSLLLMGTLAYGKGRLDEARDRLERYLELVPDDPNARKLVGSIRLRSGDAAGALEVLRPALAVAPEDPELLGLAGSALARLGRPEAAVELFQRAVRVDPRDARVRTQLALGLVALGQRARGLGELAAVFESLEDPTAGLVLGLLHLEEGETAAAAEVARALVGRDPDNPVAHNLLGATLLARGDIEGAREAFGRAVAKDPDYLPARYNLVRLDERAGDRDAARRGYEAILERGPGEVRAMAGLARLAEAEGRPAEAVQWLEKARAVDPDDLPSALALAGVYLRRGQAGEALRVARDAAERHPEAPPAGEALVRALLAAGDTAGAAAQAATLARSPGLDGAARVRVARLQIRAGDVAGARRTLEAALAAEPALLAAHAALVELDVKGGRAAAAVDRARAFRDAHPDVDGADVVLGDALLAAGRAAEAVRAYEAAWGRRETTTTAVRLARALAATGRVREGAERLRSWVERNPEDHEARRALAGAYLRAGEPDRAREHYERLAAALPDDPAVLNNLAVLYRDRDPARARGLAERAYAAAPEHPAVLDTYGWVLLAAGDAPAAVKMLREASTRAPREPSVRYHLAVALREVGRAAAARRELEQALAAGRPFAEAEDARALLASLPEN